MLPVHRFLITLVASLGLVGSAIAAPIESSDLTNPDLLIDTAYNTFVLGTDDTSDIDLSVINLSYGLQDTANDFKFLKNDMVKTSGPANVPEPNAAMLLALGLICLTALRRRKH